jgi:hypothetical protein
MRMRTLALEGPDDEQGIASVLGVVWKHRHIITIRARAAQAGQVG